MAIREFLKRLDLDYISFCLGTGMLLLMVLGGITLCVAIADCIMRSCGCG